MIDLELQYGGGDVHRARATTIAVSAAYLKEHAELVREFHNVSAWPKHLLVRYRWVETVDVDATAGMVMMLALCLAVSVGAMVGGRGTGDGGHGAKRVLGFGDQGFGIRGCGL